MPVLLARLLTVSPSREPRGQPFGTLLTREGSSNDLLRLVMRKVTPLVRGAPSRSCCLASRLWFWQGCGCRCRRPTLATLHDGQPGEGQQADYAQPGEQVTDGGIDGADSVHRHVGHHDLVIGGEVVGGGEDTSFV